MRFRMGFVTGFATGYYLGSMAGRERHEQINRWLRKARRSEAFDVATEKAREVVDVGVDRARDLKHRIDARRDQGDERDPLAGDDVVPGTTSYGSPGAGDGYSSSR